MSTAMPCRLDPTSSENSATASSNFKIHDFGGRWRKMVLGSSDLRMTSRAVKDGRIRVERPPHRHGKGQRRSTHCLIVFIHTRSRYMMGTFSYCNTVQPMVQPFSYWEALNYENGRIVVIFFHTAHPPTSKSKI